MQAEPQVQDTIRSASGPRRLTHLRAMNVFGIDTLEIDHGVATIIEGGNDLNKTNILNAMAALFGGGQQAQLLREGAEKGEIVAVLDGDTDLETTIRRAITPNGSTVTIKDRGGKSVKSPQAWLDSITDAIQLNPMRFIDADEKGRLRFLLDAMDLSLTPELRQQLIAVGVELRSNDNDLKALDQAADEIFKERTTVNSAQRGAEASVHKLSSSLPEGAKSDKTDYSDIVQGLRGDLQTQEQSLQKHLNDIETSRHEMRRAEWDRHSKAKQDLEDDYQARLRALNEERARKLEELVKINEEKTDAIHKEIEANIKNLRDDRQPAIDSLRTELATAEEREKHAISIQAQLKNIEDFGREANQHRETALLLTQKLDTIKEVKRALLGSLPIDGLEITDGKIMINGIQVERLNTAKQMKFAIEVLKLRYTERLKRGEPALNVVFIDKLEHLDSTNRPLLLEIIADAGMTVMGTLVTGGELKITNN